MKYIASVLVVALLVVGVVASYFLVNGYYFKFSNSTEFEFGVDHEPAPEYHYHIEKKGVWGT